MPKGREQIAAQMRVFDSGAMGVARGEEDLFSDFDTDGEMWTGEGDRAVRQRISFGGAFLEPPVVSLWIAMQDSTHDSNTRFDLRAEEVGRSGFTAEFRTWSDSRFARVRIGWLAIGPMANDDHWDVP